MSCSKVSSGGVGQRQAADSPLRIVQVRDTAGVWRYCMMCSSARIDHLRFASSRAVRFVSIIACSTDRRAAEMVFRLGKLEKRGAMGGRWELTMIAGE